MTHQYIRHSQSTRQLKVGALVIAVCPYGIDYYWRNKAGYMLTSAPFYISHAGKWIVDIRFGVVIYRKEGRRLIKLPTRWINFCHSKGLI